MASPVTVSRIQNRRGTQAQFDALYPAEYISAPGATSLGSVITVSTTTGLTVNAPPTVLSGTGTFAPGTIILSIDSGTTFTVSLVPIVALSGGSTVVRVPKYDGTWGVSSVLYPNILMPGELALCTDTFTVYIGNVNGGFIQFYMSSTAPGILLPPLVLQLPPTVIFPALPIFTPIPELSYLATPFFTLLYDITDNAASPDQNAVGMDFSRNGEMKITAVANVIPTPVNLSDTSVDVNNTPGPFDISFTADYSGPTIEISYSHNFPGNLTFSSSTILWLPF